MFKFLPLSFLLAISSITNAAEIDLTSPDGSSDFYQRVKSADSDGLDGLATSLREASDANAPANDKAYLMNQIAERQIELGQVEKTLPVLEYVIDHPLPDDPEIAARFASD